jgi:hypothetical protein
MLANYSRWRINKTKIVKRESQATKVKIATET